MKTGVRIFMLLLGFVLSMRSEEMEKNEYKLMISKFYSIELLVTFS